MGEIVAGSRVHYHRDLDDCGVVEEVDRNGYVSVLLDTGQRMSAPLARWVSENPA